MSRSIQKVGIFGTGKVGLSLGYHLKDRGFELGYHGRSPDAAQRCMEEIGALTFVSAEELLDWCDVIGFVVSDGAIAQVSASLSGHPRVKEKYAFHMSGALAADEIKGSYLEKFSLHPLRAFAKVEVDISGTTFALEIYKGHCSPEIDRFANEFGRVIKVATAHKTLYHASAVIASNLIVPIMDAANAVLRQIGIEDEDLLWPLVDSAIANMKNLGVTRALTGPIARGDVDTVKRHVAALSSLEDIAELYAVLSRHALGLSEISEARKEEILRVFQKGGEQ